MKAGIRETAALFALLKLRPSGASWGQLAAEVAFEGGAEAILRRSADDGALFGGFDPESAIHEASAELTRWREQGLRLVTVLDDDYPSRLLDIHEVPPFLFFQGKLQENDLGMSIVGSRKASPQALELATAAAEMLVGMDLSVIAGLASGVDSAAHRAALAGGGRTVAFIGNGITKSYPSGNSLLQRQIASDGLVLSQFYPAQPPTKQTFPMRNASMSGYGLATIIVEAGEMSGTRIQARLAVGHGRPLILSSSVVRTTSWGASLVGKPNVHVASTLGELRDHVQAIIEAPAQLEAALKALAPA